MTVTLIAKNYDSQANNRKRLRSAFVSATATITPMAKDQGEISRAALRRFMAKRKLKVQPWATRAGIAEGTLRAFLDGRTRSMTDRNLGQLAAAEDVSIDEMLGRTKETSTALIESKASHRVDSAAAMVTVPEYDVRAVAGHNGSMIEVTGENEAEMTIGRYGFPAESFRAIFGADAVGVRILEVIGDSMAPTLLPGQKIMVNLHDQSPTPPGIFVVFDGLGIVIKRVEFIAHSDPPTVRIMSDNPRYPPFDRVLGEAHIIARVIGNWGRM